jgi:uncharacterized membrane protein
MRAMPDRRCLCAVMDFVNMCRRVVLPRRQGDTIVEGLIALGLLIVLAFPIASIVALVSSSGARRHLRVLEARVAGLEATRSDSTAVDRLEGRPTALEAAERGAARPTPPPAVLQSSLAAPEAPPPETRPPAPPPPIDAVQPETIPVAPPAAAPPAPASPPRQSLEERFGTRWVVWVGGLALALGGVFLVRYSIEQGLVGPGVRVMLGALLAAALVGGGEWLRRQDNRAGIVGLPAAHIPSILTAAGTTVAYATVFAAYALYDFIGPAAAFGLLGVVALATLAAALLHGPALAALGLVGADVTPLLVASDTPNYWALYIYVAVVTAAAFALARARLWRWLAVTAVAFGVFWTLPGIVDATAGTLAPHIFHVMVGFGLAAVFIVAGLYYGPAATPGRMDAISSGAVAAYLLAAALLVVARDHDPAALTAFAILTAATVAIAWRSDAAAAALPAGALLSALVVIAWAVEPEFGHLVASGPGSGLAAEPSQADIALHFGLGAFFAGLFGATGYLAQGRYARATIPVIWSATAVLAPLAILIALYYRIYGLERSLPFAGLALLLAAWFAVATEQLGKRSQRPGVAAAAALHAVGCAASLALTLTFALEKGWLTVGLALMAPGIAWVAQKRPLPMLRWIAAVAAVLVVARIAWEPRIVGADVGTTPFFNWLLYGYGVPAASFWTAGYLLRRRADDVPSRMLDAAAILFTVLFAVLEIRHAMNGGDIYAARSGLGELALQVAVGLAMAIGLERLRLRTRNVVHDTAALIIAAVTLGAIVIGLLGVENPWLTGVPVGGVFLNLILVGYGLPAALAITLALMARHTRPTPYRAVAAGVAVLLALAYLTLEVMRLYHGPVLSDGIIGNPEQYTFSAVWLAFGVVLLMVGLIINSKPARLASAAVVLLTIAKVFLIDMADLAGIWRALSFIGLGLVLVGIGYLYQRLLFPPRPAAAVPAPEGRNDRTTGTG